MKYLQYIVLCILDTIGTLSIDYTCWFSNKYFDIHDYHQDYGGDGIPTHDHIYSCWNCGKKFTI